MRRWPARVEGMTTSKRAQRRKPETDQDGPEATTQRYSGVKRVHREVECEGHEEIVSRRRRIASCCAKDEGGPLETAL